MVCFPRGVKRGSETGSGEVEGNGGPQGKGDNWDATATGEAVTHHRQAEGGA